MARTRAGAELTQMHRRRQLALRAATLGDMLELWPAFDLENIDDSWPPLEAGLLTVIKSRRRESSDLAVNYYRALRVAEGAAGEAVPQIAEPPADDFTRATLHLLGPVAAKKAIAAKRPRVADRTLTRLAGKVAKQVLDGGRETLTATARADRFVAGWRRITDGNPCDFCEAIAAQGVIGVDVDFAAHDHCGCTQEVAFTA